jgi:predicted transcriptional regulator
MITTNNVRIAQGKKAFYIDEQKIVGERLRRAREARGLTLEQVAIAAGVTVHNMHCYEQGSPAPPDVLIKLACEVYRGSLHDIVYSSPVDAGMQRMSHSSASTSTS